MQREFDWVVTDVEPGDTTAHHYGLAVDYGSTTIVMQLVDLNSGAVMGEEAAVSGQVAYGTDILTRITYALEKASHRADLRRATADTFHLLLEKLTENTGVPAASLPIMVISGNTTMIHFLLELDAWTVFASPFAPVTAEPGFLWGREVGLEFEGPVYIIPAASNYVGGDIVSGLLALEIHKKEETNMFFDIGTNGELVIGNRHWMIAGAGAAGPALEGYISKFGMRAAPGAIDSVQIRGGGAFPSVSVRRVPGPFGFGICHYHRHFSGSAPGKIRLGQKQLPGGSQTAAAGPGPTGGGKGSGGKYVLRAICLHPGFSGADAGGKIHSPYGYAAVSFRKNLSPAAILLARAGRSWYNQTRNQSIEEGGRV